jgi:hypothetical protein
MPPPRFRDGIDVCPEWSVTGDGIRLGSVILKDKRLAQEEGGDIDCCGSLAIIMEQFHGFVA